MSGDDFVTRLQLQLRDAAEREARRGRLARAGAALRLPRIPAPMLAGAAIACALAIALVLVIGRPAPRDAARPIPPGDGLTVVTDTQLVTKGGWVTAAFGSVWVHDAGTGELLRIDPRSRRVLARFQVGDQVSVLPAAGSIWVAENGRLVRIDPATDRVVARIPLQLDGPALVAAGRGYLWLVTALDLLRVDPRRDVLDRTVHIEHDSFMLNGFASDGGARLYVRRADGTLLVLDGASGARLASRRGVEGQLLWGVDGAVLLGRDGAIVALDVRSGRERWRADVGAERINDSFVERGVLWLHVTDRATARDRLVRVDVRDGKVTGSVTLPQFGFGGGAAVGGDYWVVSPGGRLMIVR